MRKLIAASVFSLFILGCTAQNKEPIEVVSVEEIAQVLKEDEVQLIDVRTPEEYAEGKIGNAKNINVLEDAFATEVQELDKEKPVYVYCKSGKRSAMAAKKMIALGFTKVYDLSGGITSWEESKK